MPFNVQGKPCVGIVRAFFWTMVCTTTTRVDGLLQPTHRRLLALPLLKHTEFPSSHAYSRIEGRRPCASGQPFGCSRQSEFETGGMAGARPHVIDEETTVAPSQAIGHAAASSLRSVTFSKLPRDQEPDLLCDFLMEIGAVSTSIVDADYGTLAEDPVFGEPNGGILSRENSSGMKYVSWNAVCWNSSNVTALFPASTNIPATVQLVRDIFSDEEESSESSNNDNLAFACDYDFDDYTLDQVPNRDWVYHVQQGWKPCVIADQFLLTFPWHTEQDIAEACDKSTDDALVRIELQGGVAFGTGEHPTTQLCLEWLSHHVKDNMQADGSLTEPIHVLDYGSGSGVLGMAACALSNDVTATGIDLDVDACHIANENANINDLPMQSYLPPLEESDDAESKSLLLKAYALAQENEARDANSRETSILLSNELPKFDVCVANILAAPLVSLAPMLHCLLNDGAPIGMSGILVAQGQSVAQAYEDAGFENVSISRESGGWVLVTAVKPIAS